MIDAAVEQLHAALRAIESLPGHEDAAGHLRGIIINVVVIEACRRRPNRQERSKSRKSRAH